MKRLLLIALAVLAATLVGGAGLTYAKPGGPGGRGGPPGGSIGGQVTSVSGSTITVSNREGTASIATTSSTTYEVNGTAATLASITVGLFVHAEGSKDASGTFTATKVVGSSTRPAPPAGGPGGPPRGGVGGEVTSVLGATITVENREGTASIATTSSTTYEVNGAPATLASITVGLYLHAEGSKDASGTFTATKVVASSTRPAPPAGGPRPRR